MCVCVWGGGGGELMIIRYPPCKKGIRPGICVQPAVSHEAGRLASRRYKAVSLFYK